MRCSQLNIYCSPNLQKLFFRILVAGEVYIFLIAVPFNNIVCPVDTQFSRLAEVQRTSFNII